ncbi:HAD-IA family hydrolase [Nonomuraea ferruginea]
MEFADVAALTAADLESWSQVDQEMVALVHELADRGVKLGLLSNISEDLVPVRERNHGDWLGRFDALTYSCRIGVAKPDPRAYEICAARLGVAPRDALFFDDNEVNVAGGAGGGDAQPSCSPHRTRSAPSSVSGSVSLRRMAWWLRGMRTLPSAPHRCGARTTARLSRPACDLTSGGSRPNLITRPGSEPDAGQADGPQGRVP